MIYRLGLAACSSAALMISAAAQDQNDRRFTAERVFDMEHADDPQISPDGETIVYVRRSMDRQSDRVRGDLWMLDVETGTHTPLEVGGGSAGSPRWSPDGSKLLYTTVSGGKPELRVRYMASGRSASLAVFNAPPRQAVWSPDGTSVAFTMFTPSQGPSFAKAPSAPAGAEWNAPVRVFDDVQFRFDGAGYLSEGASHVYTVPVGGGAPRQITSGEADFTAPEWLGNDTLLVVGNEADDRDMDPIEAEIYAVSVSDLSRTVLTSRDGPDGNPAVSPDGSLIAFTGYDDEVKSYQQTDLFVMAPDGSDVRRLTGDFDRSIGSMVWHPNGEQLVVQVENAGEIDLVSIDLDGEVTTFQTGLGGTAIGRPYGGAAFSLSEGRRPTLAYTANLKDRPSEIAVSGRRVEDRILTDLNSDIIDYLDMAPLEEIKVASSHDGIEIEAWAALPPGFTKDGSYPMILEIHGGPFAMYGPFFSAEIQRYAAEGYVAVYVNPRGSTSYGEDFAHLIDLNYPGEDYDDLMSVVDHLVAENYVSPDRLFVTGGSGGGVLTSWIVGKTDRFAAAATVKPVINWFTMALTADIGVFVRRHWIREDPIANPEAYWEKSPISLVNNVKTPTLVMVGEEDWRTPTWEAEQYYGALKQNGVDTALVRIPSSPHYIAGRPSRLIAKVDNIMGWFAKYDPGRKSADADD